MFKWKSWTLWSGQCKFLISPPLRSRSWNGSKLLVGSHSPGFSPKKLKYNIQEFMKICHRLSEDQIDTIMDKFGKEKNGQVSSSIAVQKLWLINNLTFFENYWSRGGICHQSTKIAKKNYISSSLPPGV